MPRGGGGGNSQEMYHQPAVAVAGGSGTLVWFDTRCVNLKDNDVVTLNYPALILDVFVPNYFISCLYVIH